VGAVFAEPDRAEVAEAVRMYDAVGSRERRTRDLLSSLDLESAQVLDGAAFFAQGAALSATDSLPSGHIAATSAPGATPGHDYQTHMARLLVLAYEHLQLPIRLLPQVSTVGARYGDQECHAAIASRKAPDVRLSWFNYQANRRSSGPWTGGY
jgi:hypothetical protein